MGILSALKNWPAKKIEKYEKYLCNLATDKVVGVRLRLAELV